MHTRARMLLLLDRHQAEPWTDEAIAKALRCHRNTVGNVRHRFIAARLSAALYHKPLLPRAPKQITGEVEAHVLALACSAPPRGSSVGPSGSSRIASSHVGWSIASVMWQSVHGYKNAIKPWHGPP